MFQGVSRSFRKFQGLLKDFHDVSGSFREFQGVSRTFEAFSRCLREFQLDFRMIFMVFHGVSGSSEKSEKSDFTSGIRLILLYPSSYGIFKEI